LNALALSNWQPSPATSIQPGLEFPAPQDEPDESEALVTAHAEARERGDHGEADRLLGVLRARARLPAEDRDTYDPIELERDAVAEALRVAIKTAIGDREPQAMALLDELRALAGRAAALDDQRVRLAYALCCVHARAPTAALRCELDALAAMPSATDEQHNRRVCAWSNAFQHALQARDPAEVAAMLPVLGELHAAEATGDSLRTTIAWRLVAGYGHKRRTGWQAVAEECAAAVQRIGVAAESERHVLGWLVLTYGSDPAIRGLTIERDLLTDAIARVRSRAEGGDCDHQLALARGYSEGHVVERDVVESARWYLRAAEGGRVAAQYGIAVCHHRGLGVERNAADARVWYERAASQGSDDGVRALRVMNFEAVMRIRSDVWWRGLSVVGGSLLLLHLVTQPLAFHPVAALVYPIITIAMHLGPLEVLERLLFPRQADEDAAGPSRDQMRAQFAQKSSWVVMATEDGLTLAPLAFIGVNVWTVAVASAVFGAIHYPSYSWSLSTRKGISRFVTALVLLPYGLLSVIAGHLLLDLVIYWWILRSLRDEYDG
jgi:hypothetical protein